MQYVNNTRTSHNFKFDGVLGEKATQASQTNTPVRGRTTRNLEHASIEPVDDLLVILRYYCFNTSYKRCCVHLATRTVIAVQLAGVFICIPGTLHWCVQAKRVSAVDELVISPFFIYLFLLVD